MESGRDDRRWRAKEELTKVSRTPVRRGTEQAMKYNTHGAFTRRVRAALSDAAILSASGDAVC